MALYTTEEIILKFRKIHQDTYDYSKVVYVGTMKGVTITCKRHGDFIQAPNTHLYGKGCMQCAVEKRANNRRGNLESFLEKAKEVHGEKFDYSNSIYTLSNKNLEIICKTHGSFFTSPSNHLAGNDCPKCSQEKKNAAKRSNTKEFLEKCEKIWQDRYDYSKVIYGKNNEEKVEIVCDTHGSFFTKPNNFLNGKGCPSCAKQGFVPSKAAWIYILESKSGITKVGISYDANYRHRHICKDSKIDFKLASKFYLEKGSDAYDVEQQVLFELRSKYETIPFNFSGSTECFYDVSAKEVERLVVSKLINLPKSKTY